jgi:hypothetical protein
MDHTTHHPRTLFCRDPRPAVTVHSTGYIADCVYTHSAAMGGVLARPCIFTSLDWLSGVLPFSPTGELPFKSLVNQLFTFAAIGFTVNGIKFSVPFFEKQLQEQPCITNAIKSGDLYSTHLKILINILPSRQNDSLAVYTL